MTMRKLLCLSLLTAAIAAVTSAQEPDPGVIVFKSSVEQVAVAALVRDSRGSLSPTSNPATSSCSMTARGGS